MPDIFVRKLEIGAEFGPPLRSQAALRSFPSVRSRRKLARFVIGSTTAGQMLVDEGLARPWRGRQPGSQKPEHPGTESWPSPATDPLVRSSAIYAGSPSRRPRRQRLCKARSGC